MDLENDDLRRGRAKPVAILFALVVIVGGVGFAGFIALRGSTPGAALGPAQIADEKRAASLAPLGEALVKWRGWAADPATPKLQEEGLVQLAWAKDAEGIRLAAQGLASSDHRVRGTAATALIEYGSPAADVAKPALEKALREADDSDRPQVLWALTTLREPSVFDAAMGEYRKGHLAQVQRLDGSPAFDPLMLAHLVPVEKFSTLASDPNESVRQLVATVLSNHADAQYTDALIALASDPSTDVAREAAVGLGKIGSERALAPLLGALGKANRDSRPRFLEALRDGVGGSGMVMALRAVPHTADDRERFERQAIFAMIHELADPRAGDALAAYMTEQTAPHWKTEAALRLAEIGDLRALPVLAWRMKQEPPALYGAVPDEERLWGRDDKERVVAARMLADLALIYPGKREEIRKQAYEGVKYWLTDKPQPHANGMRFMAAADAREILPTMRGWAFPTDPLPRIGEQQLSPAWATAQSALRYLGWMRDEASRGRLESTLTRRPPGLDATMEALNQGGEAVLGMTLRGLGVGASEGLAQWGEPQGVPILLRYIEDRQNNEQARIAACAAAGWLATREQMATIIAKLQAYDRPDPKAQFVRGCYLEALVRHPVPEAAPALMAMINDKVDLEVRHQAARALGFGGLSAESSLQLSSKLADPAIRNDVALALLLGADVDTVRRTIAIYNDVDTATLEDLKILYAQSFGLWSDRNYDAGDVYRWIVNATMASRVKVRDALQDWPRLVLAHALQEIDWDNGPHSLTRVQFRMRLLGDALSGEQSKQHQAVSVLKFMGEKGVLMALKSEAPPLGPFARQAFFELVNPKIATEALPDAKPRSARP